MKDKFNERKSPTKKFKLIIDKVLQSNESCDFEPEDEHVEKTKEKNVHQSKYSNVNKSHKKNSRSDTDMIFGF